MNNPTPANPNMADTLLFEHFATLATAPDGIARLRELILQLAVQGKLGTQDAGDEPASKLSSRILEEKKRLIKKGEISKPRALPEIESEEIPFHIPKNWVWLRMEDIGHSCGQKEPDKIFTYIDVTAINKERGLIGDEVNVLQPNEAPSRARKLVKKGTVIYSTVRPYLLNIAIVDKDFNPEPIVSTAFAVLHPFEGIFNRYLFYYLRSKPFIEYVESQMTGMAYPAINDQKFHMGLIPVPPTAEQHRIVAKVDRLMALCDELEARQQQERAGCLKLGTASLTGLQNAESPEEFGRQWAQVCDEFDLILDCPENVAVLRQTILQLAVQGRLVRQEPGDEPANKLVEKIQKDKMQLIKQDKIPVEKPVEPAEDCDFLPVIPKNWSLARFGEISNKIQYGYTASADHNNKKVRLIRITDIQNSQVIWDTVPGCEITDSNYSSYAIGIGDLLIARTGGTIGKSYLVRDIPVPAVFASYLIRIVPNKNLDPEYVKLFADSPTYWNQLYEKCMGTGQPNVNGTSLRSLIVPIPPIAEQHRIVATVDALMALCDALESRLKERAGVQGRLAGAVVMQEAG